MPKRFVYVLRNAEIPLRYYTGVTSDVARRHADHNAGGCTLDVVTIDTANHPRAHARQEAASRSPLRGTRTAMGSGYAALRRMQLRLTRFT